MQNVFTFPDGRNFALCYAQIPLGASHRQDTPLRSPQDLDQLMAYLGNAKIASIWRDFYLEHASSQRASPNAPISEMRKRIKEDLWKGRLYFIPRDAPEDKPENIDQAIRTARTSLQMHLRTIIQDEQKEKAKIEADYEKLSAAEKAAFSAKKAATGLGKAAKDFLIWANDLADVIDVNRRAIRVVEAAKKTYWDQNKKSWGENLVQAEYKEIIEMLGFDPAKITRAQVEDAYELANLIWSDIETRNILKQFSIDYAKAQHHTEWTEMAGGLAFEVILTIIIAALSCGAGGVAVVAKNVQLLGRLEKAGQSLLIIGKKLKSLNVRKQRKVIKTDSAPSSSGPAPKSKYDKADETQHNAGAKPAAQPQPQAAPAQKQAESKGEIKHVEPAKVTPESPAGSPIASACTTEGCPISMVSGEELLPLVDGNLPGPLPFEWKRIYRSAHSRDIGLGHGWTHAGCDYIEEQADQLIYWDDEGRMLSMPRPEIGQSTHLINEQLRIIQVADGVYRLVKKQEPIKEFSRTGNAHHARLQRILHPTAAFTLQFEYENNQLCAIVSNWGRSLWFERNLQGRINKVIFKNQHSTQQKLVAEYDYSEAGDLIAQRNAIGIGERYEYKNHLFTRRILATGFSYYYQWDGEDNTARCLRNWGDDGIYNYRFSWQPQTNQSSATDSNGYTNHYTYNEFGQITQKIDKEGGVHRWDYRDGLCIRYTDPEGNCTYYNFNEARDLISVTDPLNNSNSIEYSDGLISRSQDKNGAQWNYHHNAIGQLIAVTDPAGQTTHLNYNAQGLLVEERQGKTRVRRYEWDAEAQLIRVQQTQGHSQSFKYNSFGQLIQTDVWARSRAHVGTTRYQYNDAGQLIHIIYDNGEKAHYAYDANGLVNSIKDRHGRITRFDYDGLSQVVRKTDPEGFTLEYKYDKERNLIALINQNGERYEFAYDGNERLISEIGFDGRQQTYQYNKAGHLISSTDGDNIVVNYRRDALGRMLAKSYRLSDQEVATEISRYRYNASGQLVETYNQNQHLEFGYDAFGRLIREEQTLIDEQNRLIKNSKKVVEFARNQLGALTQLHLPGNQFVHYAYDQFDQLQSVGFNQQEITRIERDELGREISRQQGDVQSAFEYDPMGRLVKQHAQHKDRQTNIIDRRYEYDNAGNLSQVSDGAWQIKYVYDQLNRLKETQGDLAETFVFDPASNLLGNDKNAQVKGNRLLMQADRKFTYDARGNLIHEQRGKAGVIQTTFRYNLANQLIEVSKNNQLIRFAYDPLGRRIYKQDEFGRTDFIWAGDQLAQEIRGGNVKTYIFEPESFRPLAVAQNDSIYHYHLDHLGTPKELTNEQGKIVWQARYKTYGSLALKEVDEFENNLRFQGQYYDLETGLHYNRHRYYDPSIGQFISQDPIGLLGGVNNYQYAPNPTEWVDPFGLTCKENSWNTFQRNTKGHFPSSSEASKSYQELKRVQAMEKADRLEVSEYLPKSYIEAHIGKFLEGASYFAPKWALDTFGRELVGRRDGQFVMSKAQLDDVLIKTGGDMAKIETELGIPAGDWQKQEMVVVEIADPKAHNVRMATGREEGANALWLAGGKLPTGHDEAIVDAIPKGSYKEMSISEATVNARKKP
ncbi:MAG: RHS repeat-associated core domain-containing protein [Marinagarivorans sp.]